MTLPTNPSEVCEFAAKTVEMGGQSEWDELNVIVEDCGKIAIDLTKSPLDTAHVYALCKMVQSLAANLARLRDGLNR